MTLYSPVTGRLVHHHNCTYCRHLVIIPGNKKRRIRELERCGLTMGSIPEPWSSGTRLCDRYQQRGCECNSCAPNGTRT